MCWLNSDYIEKNATVIVGMILICKWTRLGV